MKLFLLCALALLLSASDLFANPSGGVVTHGNAILTPGGDSLIIRQTSDRAVIEWADFSIDAGETTRFIQPGKTSATLNRVITGNPSHIFGHLKSNGQVLLINPNGILVGPGGRVDAGGGFIASTLDLPDSDFLDGGDSTFSGRSLAAVANLGTIVAAEGDVVLLSGGNVSNAGDISAPNGVAGLASGTRVLVKSSGDERIFVQAGSSGNVDHSGTIRAAQAEVRAVGSAEQLAVNASGLIEATGVQRRGGRILLTAGSGGASVSAPLRATRRNGDGGTVRVDSSGPTLIATPIDVSSNTGSGGRVEITGGDVSLSAGTSINASGATGGGEILVGGGFQGNEAGVRNAGTTTVERDVILNAGTVGNAEAGRVIVWADDTTIFRGQAIVTAENGDAGFVEVSGKRNLLYRGTVDLSSEFGNSGRLLLDPDNVVIVQGAAGAGADSAEIADGVINAGDSPGATFTITTGDIAAINGDVDILATNDITAVGPINIIGNGDISFDAQAGDADFSSATISTAGNQVQIFAGGNILFNAIDTSSGTPGGDGGNVFLVAGGFTSGNSIDARGAAGGGGQNGGNGGSVAIVDFLGGQTITVDTINTSGANGGGGSPDSPGGDGGNAGFISVGNGTTPSSITINNIVYAGGTGADGNRPGLGGEGGSLFVNNATAIPDRRGPDGQPGTDLSIQDNGNNIIMNNMELPPFIYGPGFNTWIGDSIDLNVLAMEYQLETFGTNSVSDTGALAGDGLPGAFNPYGQTTFDFNSGQFPRDDASVYDSVTGLPYHDPLSIECRFFSPLYELELFFGTFDDAAIADFLDQSGAPLERGIENSEDAEIIAGSPPEPVRTQSGETVIGGGGGSGILGGAFNAIIRGARGNANRNRNANRAGVGVGAGNVAGVAPAQARPDREARARNPRELNQAIDRRDEAQDGANDAEANKEAADAAAKKAADDLDDRRDERDDALDRRQAQEAALAAQRDQLAKKNELLENLLADRPDLENTAEFRAAVAEQADKLSREIAELRGEIKEAEAELAEARDDERVAERGVAAAENELRQQQNEADKAQADVNRADRELKNQQEQVKREIAKRNEQDRKDERARELAAEARAAERRRQQALENKRQNEEAQKQFERENALAIERRKARNEAFAEAEELDVPLDEVTRDDSDNLAQTVQDRIISQGRVAADEDTAVRAQSENPFETDDARTFASPLIIELFDLRDEAVDSGQFVGEGELSIGDFVDASPDVDFFQQSRLSNDGEVLIVTQTLVNKATGEFTTVESDIRLVEKSAVGQRADDVRRQVDNLQNNRDRQRGEAPLPRVIRGNINTPVGN